MDLDDGIVRRSGMSIVRIFARLGENHFRRIESALRPLLEGVALEDFIPAMLRERSAIYEEAHLIIDTDALTPSTGYRRDSEKNGGGGGALPRLAKQRGEIFCEVGKR
ncbi:MAG: hypothetical protein GXP52_07470 [Deltaproteobacteria bacterium]|nr:hypothetical protein [Deltaproteobacteria bacterium]